MTQRYILFRNAAGRLATRKMEENGEVTEIPVRAYRCFPLSQPDQFISIKDDSGKEIYFLESLDELADAGMRALVEESLAEQSFMPTITGIARIEEHNDLHRWQVQTDAGPRIFFTSPSTKPREMAGGGIMLTDIFGDRYILPDINAIEVKGRRLLLAYLD